jgi:hypothetical protein
MEELHRIVGRIHHIGKGWQNEEQMHLSQFNDDAILARAKTFVSPTLRVVSVKRVSG